MFEIRYDTQGYYIYLNGRNYNVYVQKDGTISEFYEGCFPTCEAAQEFLDAWLPPKEWLTQEQVIEAAKQGDREALDCYILHYKQIVVAGWDEYNNAWAKNLVSTFSCKEYRNLKDKTGVEFEKASIEMLNRLIRERNKMSKKIEISGYGSVSEETIAEALKEKFAKEGKAEKPYQFQAGDMAENRCGQKRIIVYIPDDNKFLGKTVSFGNDGTYQSTSQDVFNEEGYKKIGELSDFIK